MKLKCRRMPLFIIALLLFSLLTTAPTKAQVLAGRIATSEISGNSLQPAFNLIVNGGVVAAGVGLREIGEGDIVIDSIPEGASVTLALLYWATLGQNGTWTSPTINGTSVSGSLIGTSADTCWGAENSFAYRADVTAIVSGNGLYSIADLPTFGPLIDDSQGASLVVVYSDPSLPLRKVIINEGAVTLESDNLSYTDTITGFASFGPVLGEVTYLVGDGQLIFDSAFEVVVFNGVTVAAEIFIGADGPYWDTATVDVSTVPATDPSTTSLIRELDCLVWISTIFDGEAGAWFAELPHRPLGQARLDFVEENLVVSNLGSSGEDGVSIDVSGCQTCLPHLTGWGIELESLTLELGQVWQTRLLKGGNVVGVSRLSGVADGIELEVDFFEGNSGASLLVEAYLDGKLVRSQVVPLTPPVLEPGEFFLKNIVKFFVHDFDRFKFRNALTPVIDSNDQFLKSQEYSFVSPLSIVIEGDPGGLVEIDQVRISLLEPLVVSEDLLDFVELYGSDLTSLSIVDEEVFSDGPLFADGFESGDTSEWSQIIF